MKVVIAGTGNIQVFDGTVKVAVIDPRSGRVMFFNRVYSRERAAVESLVWSYLDRGVRLQW